MEKHKILLSHHINPLGKQTHCYAKMPSSKKQEQQQQQTDVSREDRVDEFVKMYPVFCTANIPPQV